jgi:hypothetical protein
MTVNTSAGTGCADLIQYTSILYGDKTCTLATRLKPLLCLLQVNPSLAPLICKSNESLTKQVIWLLSMLQKE